MKIIERIEKELYESGAMDIYKLIRKKIKKLKKHCGFECKMCGSCCTPSAGLFYEDFFYMKEKGVDQYGVRTYKTSDGSLIPKDLNYKTSELRFCFFINPLIRNRHSFISFKTTFYF